MPATTTYHRDCRVLGIDLPVRRDYQLDWEDLNMLWKKASCWAGRDDTACFTGYVKGDTANGTHCGRRSARFAANDTRTAAWALWFVEQAFWRFRNLLGGREVSPLSLNMPVQLF